MADDMMDRKSVQYVGATPEEAQGRYQADALRAYADGWVVESVQWELQASQPTLLVSYVPAPTPMPTNPSEMPPDERPYASVVCPSCGATLDPPPKAKKRCPACGEDIYVRSGPDGMRHLLSERELGSHEATWEAHYDQKARAEEAQHNLDLAQSAQRQLADYAAYGVKGVEMLVSDDACPACLAYKGRTFRLADAPPLPICGCSHDLCRCDYAPLTLTEEHRVP